MKDEFLTEWIRRLAKSYGISYRAFCLRVLELDEMGMIYLNDYPGEKTLALLCKGTGQTVDDLREMTFPARWRQLKEGYAEHRSECLALYVKILKYAGIQSEWVLYE